MIKLNMELMLAKLQIYYYQSNLKKLLKCNILAFTSIFKTPILYDYINIMRILLL